MIVAHGRDRLDDAAAKGPVDDHIPLFPLTAAGARPAGTGAQRRDALPLSGPFTGESACLKTAS